ncbi:MAG: hypothetical protein SPJ13_00665 [Bacteroidales bacterium]|nr:hypothetical protein [Bacteroidales bacterium]
MEKACVPLVEALKRAMTMADGIAENGGRTAAIERDLLMATLREAYAQAMALPVMVSNPAPDVFVQFLHTEQTVGSPLPERTDDRILDGYVAQTCRAYAEANRPEPEFAYAEEETVPAYAQPSLEETEGAPYAELFEEPVPQPKAEVAPAPVPQPQDEVAPALAPQPKKETAPKLKSKPAPAPQSKEPSLFDLLNQSRVADDTAVKAAVAPKALGESLSHTVHHATEEQETHTKKSKVADLRTIININDKFSFMSELFHNNMRAYNDFILRLNALEERESALAYVKEVAQQYHWDEESLAVKTFQAIFDRKF